MPRTFEAGTSEGIPEPVNGTYFLHREHHAVLTLLNNLFLIKIHGKVAFGELTLVLLQSMQIHHSRKKDVAAAIFT